MAARWGAHNYRVYSLVGFGGQKHQIQLSGGLVPSGGCAGELSRASSLASSGGYRKTSASLVWGGVTQVSSPGLCPLPFCPLLRTLLIGFRAHLNPGRSHSETLNNRDTYSKSGHILSFQVDHSTYSTWASVGTHPSCGTHTGITRVIRQVRGEEAQAWKISGVWNGLGWRL